MLEIINYFIGAFHRLFFYVDNDWANDVNLKLAFVIIVSCFCAITLFVSLTIVKHAFIAVFNAIRKM